MLKKIKIIGLIVSGNALDYYDFMLFAHLGPVVTRVFIPDLSPVQAQLISLLLFAVPFLVRPLGGYLFGKWADQQGREQALEKTLQYASYASLGIALLPGYEAIGFMSIIFFIALRAFQGLSLGGEYTTAGTLLMEKYQHHPGGLSSILGASSSVGSLIAFCFAYLYLNDYFSDNMWRIAFAAGGVLTYISYLIRKRLKKEIQFIPLQTQSALSTSYALPYRNAVWITLSIGLLVGVTIWIPMVYVNFYWTTILGYPPAMGFEATFMALLGTLFLTPLVGFFSDRFFCSEVTMTWGALLTIPLSIIGFHGVQEGQLWGQFFLILAAVIFGAPIHALMHQLFPAAVRSRSVNTFFMMGASVGSLVPVVSGYVLNRYGIHETPMLCVVFCGTITSGLFLKNFYYRTLIQDQNKTHKSIAGG